MKQERCTKDGYLKGKPERRFPVEKFLKYCENILQLRVDIVINCFSHHDIATYHTALSVYKFLNINIIHTTHTHHS